MKQNKESNKAAPLEESLSKLKHWDSILEMLYFIFAIAMFISILSDFDEPMSSLLAAIASLQIGISILREQAAEKQRNINHEEKESRLYHYLGALWLILVMIPLIWTPSNFSKPADYVLIITYIASWLVMIAILFFKGITSKNK